MVNPQDWMTDLLDTQVGLCFEAGLWREARDLRMAVLARRFVQARRHGRSRG